MRQILQSEIREAILAADAFSPDEKFKGKDDKITVSRNIFDQVR